MRNECDHVSDGERLVNGQQVINYIGKWKKLH